MTSLCKNKQFRGALVIWICRVTQDCLPLRCKNLDGWGRVCMECTIHFRDSALCTVHFRCVCLRIRVLVPNYQQSQISPPDQGLQSRHFFAKSRSHQLREFQKSRSIGISRKERIHSKDYAKIAIECSTSIRFPHCGSGDKSTESPELLMVFPKK